MDGLAAKFLDDPPAHLVPTEAPLLFPAQQVCIMKDIAALQANVPNEPIYGEKQVIIEHYFNKHFGITKNTMELIDWRCFNHVLPKQKK